MKRYLIGEISKITGLSVHAIRYYEKNNIISPSYVDEETKYRYYSVKDTIRFEVLKECKKMNLSLEQIHRIFEAQSDSEILGIIGEQEASVRQELAHYQTIMDNIHWYQQEYQNLISKQRVCYKIHLQQLQARRVIYRENPYEETASGLAIAEIARDELEGTENVRKKYGFIANSRYWETETSLRVKGEYIDLMKEDYPYTKPSYVYTIPAGLYLCMNIAHPSWLGDTEVNAETVPQLLDIKKYMKAHNYTPKMILVEDFAQALKMFDRVRIQVQVLLEV